MEYFMMGATTPSPFAASPVMHRRELSGQEQEAMPLETLAQDAKLMVYFIGASNLFELILSFLI